MNKCEYCDHFKRDREHNMIYCKENHNYPNLRLINIMGCCDFKPRYINLLELDKEETNEDESKDYHINSNGVE